MFGSFGRITGPFPQYGWQPGGTLGAREGSAMTRAWGDLGASPPGGMPQPRDPAACLATLNAMSAAAAKGNSAVVNTQLNMAGQICGMGRPMTYTEGLAMLAYLRSQQAATGAVGAPPSSNIASTGQKPGPAAPPPPDLPVEESNLKWGVLLGAAALALWAMGA